MILGNFPLKSRTRLHVKTSFSKQVNDLMSKNSVMLIIIIIITHNDNIKRSCEQRLLPLRSYTVAINYNRCIQLLFYGETLIKLLDR